MTDGQSITVHVSDDMLERIAERAVSRIKPPSVDREPWMGTAEAASYLACSRQRIYDLVHMRDITAIPHRKEGSRLLFRRSELDRWLEQGAAAAATAGTC